MLELIVMAASRALPRVTSDTKRVNSDALESLLAAIKPDLKDVT